MTIPHDNVFQVESAFHDHYDRARRLALDPRNAILTHCNEDLFGRPYVDEHGMPVVDEAGSTMWESYPPPGFEDDTRLFPLAEHLASTLVSGSVVLRLVPEIRVRRGDVGLCADRVLTLEWGWWMRSADVKAETLNQLVEAAEPMVRKWFPLRDELKLDGRWIHAPDHVPSPIRTRAMARLRSPHNESSAERLVWIARTEGVVG